MAKCSAHEDGMHRFDYYSVDFRAYMCNCGWMTFYTDEMRRIRELKT